MTVSLLSQPPLLLRQLLFLQPPLYLAEKTVTDEEYQELCSWVTSGNSVYANPWYMAGEDGGELDFLTARRVMLELLAEC